MNARQRRVARRASARCLFNLRSSPSWNESTTNSSTGTWEPRLHEIMDTMASFVTPRTHELDAIQYLLSGQTYDDFALRAHTLLAKPRFKDKLFGFHTFGFVFSQNTMNNRSINHVILVSEPGYWPNAQQRDPDHVGLMTWPDDLDAEPGNSP